MQQNEAAVNDKAVELFRNGRTDEARSILVTFLKANPRSVIAHVNLGYMLHAAGDFEAARGAYERAVDLDPNCVQAFHGLAAAFDALGEYGLSGAFFDRACRLAPIRERPSRETPTAKSVLLLCSASIANLNAYALLDDRAFAVTTAFVEYANPQALRGHDVIFNAISEPERSNDALGTAEALVGSLGLPVVNTPAAVRASTRENNALRLAGIDGAIAPAVRRVAKAPLAAGDLPDATYPAIVRAIGHHDGRHMLRVDSGKELVECSRELPGDELFLIDFVDVRSADGNLRKYRMTIVGAELYPLHLAISKRWKVHYVTSDMEGSGENRAAEARFLGDPQSVLGDRALTALHAVRRVLQLDYAGIDFSLDRDGNVVIFEANASMFVPPVPDDAKWKYRREPTARIIDAVTTMVTASPKSAASGCATARSSVPARSSGAGPASESEL